MFDIDKAFRDAHLTSYGGRPGITIQKSKPPSGTSIYNDYKPQIEAAAKKYGYSIVLDTAKVVSFSKSSREKN